MTLKCYALGSLRPANPEPSRLFGVPGDLVLRDGITVMGVIVGVEERQVSDGRGGRMPLTYAWVLWSDNPRRHKWNWFPSDTVIQFSKAPKNVAHHYYIVKHRHVVK